MHPTNSKSSGKQYSRNAIEQRPDREERQPDGKTNNKRKHNALRGYIECGGKYIPGCAGYERIRIGKQICHLMVQIRIERLKRLP